MQSILIDTRLMWYIFVAVVQQPWFDFTLLLRLFMKYPSESGSKGNTVPPSSLEKTWEDPGRLR